MKKPANIISAIALYLLSTGISYATFNFISPNSQVIQAPPPVSQDGGLAIDPNEPKTETCPLNGQKYTKTEQSVWAQRRPLAVMIENHQESRPQSGLSKADVIYEAIAEGGITRFMALFYCDAVARDVNLAPVRSARTYFLDWASEYGEYPLYAHVGGANCSQDAATGGCKSDKRVQALEQIQSYGWGGRDGNDMNQFSIGYPTFYRDYNRLDHTVATEHTMVSSTEKLWALALERGWSNESPDGEDWQDVFEPWSFQDEPSQTGTASTIAFDFWDGFKQYDARWEYDSDSNSYKRFTGGQPHMDLETDQQLMATNIVVQFAQEIGPVDELKHMLYTTTGRGNALVFHDGTVTEARWSKTKRTDRTIFTDESGKEIKFTRGKIWIEVVATGTDVSY